MNMEDIFCNHKTGPQDQLFSHIDADGTTMTLNVTKIHASPRMKQVEVVMLQCEEGTAKLLLDTRGLEKHRIFYHMRKIKQNRTVDPILFMICDDNTLLILDGNHRYFAATTLGLPSIPAKRVPKGVWKKYIVDLPVTREILEGISHA